MQEAAALPWREMSCVRKSQNWIRGMIAPGMSFLPSPTEPSAASLWGIPSSLLFHEPFPFLLLLCATLWDCVPPGCCSHHPGKCSIPGWSLWHRSDGSANPVPPSRYSKYSLHPSCCPAPVPSPVPLLCHLCHSPTCLTHWEFLKYIFKSLHLSGR